MAPRHLPSPGRRRTTTATWLLLFLLSVAGANASAAADADAAIADKAGQSSSFFSSGVPPSPDLVRCLNADGDDEDGGGHGGNYRLQRTVYRDFVEGRPARLRYWAGRWSAKRQRAAAGGGDSGGESGESGGDSGNSKSPPFQTTLTLASSLTVARLDQLEAQCRLWTKGPVSAVVYLPVRDDGGGGQKAGGGGGGGRGAERLSDLSAAARRELDDAARAVAATFERAEADPQGCLLDVVLLFETVADDLMPGVPPVNAMRNHALLMARTPLVVMADVDLLPSASLSQWLALPVAASASSPSASSSSSSSSFSAAAAAAAAASAPPPSAASLLQEACEASDALFVLPAFETPRSPDAAAAHADAERGARAETKAELERMAAAGRVRQFAVRIFHEGHDGTDYARWWRLPFYAAGGGAGGSAEARGGGGGAGDKSAETQGGDGGADGSGAAAAPRPLLASAYAVAPSADYEPWFALARGRNPWYDARFRGYGWNKVTHVARLAAIGFQFRVLPSGYLVHRQHARSSADLLYQSQKKAYEAAAAATGAAVGGRHGAAGEAAAAAAATAAAFESVAGVTHRLRDAVVASLAAAREGGRAYAPALDAGLRGCVATLPWWRAVRGRAIEDAAAGPAGGAEADDEGGDPGGGLLFVGAGRAGERAHLAATLAEEER